MLLQGRGHLVCVEFTPVIFPDSGKNPQLSWGNMPVIAGRRIDYYDSPSPHAGRRQISIFFINLVKKVKL